MMKYLILIITLIGCTSSKIISTESFFEEKTYYSLEEGIKYAQSSDKYIFIAVFEDNDRLSYSKSVGKVLNFYLPDDKMYMKILYRDFVIVKTYRNQLRSYLGNMANKDQKVASLQSFNEIELKSFVFISAPNYFSIYSPEKFGDKEELRDMIWVKMGP